MILEKKCAGTGKAKGNGCGELTDVRKRKYGLCPNCYYSWYKEWLSTNGDYIIQKAILKAKSIIKSDKNKKHKIDREKLKTLGQYEMDAKRSFQKFIRLRDTNENCISCGNSQSDIFDGGHFRKAELYSGVIFNELNCHKQCRYCNRFLGGNEANYRNGLVKRIGEFKLAELEQLAIDTKIYKYTKQELIDIKKMYDLKIKELKINNNIL